jgi:hypothetical protein
MKWDFGRLSALRFDRFLRYLPGKYFLSIPAITT